MTRSWGVLKLHTEGTCSRCGVLLQIYCISNGGVPIRGGPPVTSMDKVITYGRRLACHELLQNATQTEFFASPTQT